MPLNPPETETPVDPIHALIVAASVAVEGARRNLQTAASEANGYTVSILLFEVHRAAADLANRLAQIESAVRHDAEGKP